MKTQISRHSDRPEMRYSGVYQQQGRMLLDSDANELMEIVRRALAELGDSAVGGGAPRQGGVIDLSGDPTVRFGEARVGGMLARLARVPGTAGTNPYTDQSDFPGAPPRPAEPHVLYLDVWERVVTPLEDRDLVDPALHGADTTTRTRTMTQLKWCPAPPAGEVPVCARAETNPPRGTARLREVRLREAARTGTDPCDPCADELDPEARLDNHLFRIEVHHVEGRPGDPDRVVLKWSSENGAEQHVSTAVPPAFDVEDRMYELYDLAAEQQLGIHLAPGFTPARGVLSAALPAGVAGRLVRRWDGCVTLVKADGRFRVDTDALRVDRGTVLEQRLVPDDDHGTVVIDEAAGTLRLNLQELVVELAIGAGAAFVAGDYWLALVREREEEGFRARVVREQPIGVIHHTLTLGRVENATDLRVSLDPATRRRFAFPPLTDVRASDVGFGGAACSLLDGANTVEEALDALCELGAQHVAYTNTGCESGLLATVTTVDEALDALCRIDASHVGLRDAAGPLSGARTVDDALAELASRLGAGEDLCAALLALFGRGILCGGLPQVGATAPVRAGAPAVLSVNVEPGRGVNGRGCYTEFPALRMATTLRGFADREVVFDFAPQAVQDRLAERLRVLAEGGPVETVTGLELTAEHRERLTEEARGALVRRLADGEASGGTRVHTVVARVLPGADPLLVAELADAALIAADPSLPAQGEVDLFLYLLVEPGGTPMLDVQGFKRGDPIALPPPLVEAINAPAAGPAIGAGATCRSAQDQAWDLYRTVACPPVADDGRVCLGRIGVVGDRAWVSPDEREQLFPTPAMTSANWRRQRRSVHQELREACLAGEATLVPLEFGGLPLDGRAFLADGSEQQGIVRLAGPARGAAVDVTMAGDGLAVRPASVRIEVGQSSAPFFFRLPVGSTAAATVRAQVAGQPEQTASVSGIALEPLVLAGAPLAGRRLLSGETVAANVSLSAPAPAPVRVVLQAGAGITLGASELFLGAGQRTAAVLVTPQPGQAGARTLAAQVGQMRAEAGFTLVALAQLQRADGSPLHGAELREGTSLQARVALSGPTPRAVQVALTPAGGLTAPDAASVADGAEASSGFTVGGTAPGIRVLRASLLGQTVTAAVAVTEKPKDVKDTKEDKDGKEEEKREIDKLARKEKDRDIGGGGRPVEPFGPLGPLGPGRIVDGEGRSFIRPEERPDVGRDVWPEEPES